MSIQPFGVRRRVASKATAVSDQPKADNLDQLLNLSDRWTRQLKAEYRAIQKKLRQRESRRHAGGACGHTLKDVRAFIDTWRGDLLESEPHYEVHRELGAGLMAPARLCALHADLSDVW